MQRRIPLWFFLRTRVRVPVGLGLSAVTGAMHAQDPCVACHANRDIIGRIAPDSAAAERVLVDPRRYDLSAHGELGFACRTCHSDIESFPHTSALPVQCGTCHPAVAARWAASVHGQRRADADAVPARCVDCHSQHDIRHPTDPSSRVYRLTQFKSCARCHSDSAVMAPFGQSNVEPVETYLLSVHGRSLLEKGLAVVPLCTDCHAINEEAHRIQPVADTASPVNRGHVAETCGLCHVGIREQWRRGIHGQQFAAGNRDVPTCTDCHREHAVRPVHDPSSAVYPTHLAQTCGACHDREDLNDKYDIPSARRTSFEDSFHGIALASGELKVANCESCHGAHEILPSSDTASSVSPANLVATCGGCHTDIGAGVTKGRIHVASVRRDIGTLAWIVQWLYYVIIGGIVLYGLAVITLDQYRHRVIDLRQRGSGDE